MTLPSTHTFKIAVFISGNGSNLQAIIDQVHLDNNIPIEISAVVSNKKCAYGLERAKQANIPTEIIEHQNFDSRESFDEALHQKVKEFKVDLIVLAGFMRILTEKFVNQWNEKIINIHPSLLPKYKGTQTHERALEARDTVHGCSVHYVIPDLDSGQIIDQASCKIDQQDTVESLQKKVHTLEHMLYPKCILMHFDLYNKNNIK